jgi:hypothetical protein
VPRDSRTVSVANAPWNWPKDPTVTPSEYIFAIGTTHTHRLVRNLRCACTTVDSTIRLGYAGFGPDKLATKLAIGLTTRPVPQPRRRAGGTGFTPASTISWKRQRAERSRPSSWGRSRPPFRDFRVWPVRRVRPPTAGAPHGAFLPSLTGGRRGDRRLCCPAALTAGPLDALVDPYEPRPLTPGMGCETFRWYWRGRCMTALSVVTGETLVRAR